MPCLFDCLCWLLDLVITSLSLTVRFSYLVMFCHLWFDILLSFMMFCHHFLWLWCIVIYSLVFHHIALLLQTCLLKCARYSEKAFNIDLIASCSTLFVGHDCYIYTIVSPFPYLYYLAGCLCGCVRYTPLVIYFHIEALMLMSNDALSDLFYLLMLACSRIYGFHCCLVALLRIFIRSVLSYPIYVFSILLLT